MKELWPLEENKYIFLFYGETLPSIDEQGTGNAHFL